jgi:hypothetical protein
MQPARELRAKKIQAKPNKSKRKSLDWLGFPWCYSSESGLFKGLRPKKLKRISRRPTRAPVLCNASNRSSSLSPRPTPGRADMI